MRIADVKNGKTVQLKLRKTYLAVFGSPYYSDYSICCRASAGSRPYSCAIRDFWFDGSMVPWFHGSISKCLAAAPVFLFRATRHFFLFSCEFKICAEVIVHRMFAVFLNSLNGKNSSRTIVRDIFRFFFMLGFKISYSEYFLSHRAELFKAGLR